MFKKFIATLGCSAALLFAAEFQVGTYFPNWLQYSQFTPDDVRYEFLTHIHYGYFIPSEDGSSITNSDENDNPNFEKLASLSKEKKVSLTVNVGGVGNEEAMKAVASSEEARAALAEAAKSLVDQYGLAGIEIDWIPAEEEEYASWGALVTALADAGVNVSATVAGSSDAAKLYPADALAKLTTAMVMLTDQMSEEESSVKPNSDFSYAQEVLKAYAEAGISSGNVVPVVPMYGKTFLGATGLGSSHQGSGSGNEGYLTYKELMNVFDAPDYQVTFDEATQSEVAVSSSETIVFNGIPSMKSLATFVKDNGFGGMALYDISGDHKAPIVSLLVTVGQVLRPEIKYNAKKK